MKIESGKHAFEFEANGDNQPRSATLGIVAALRAVVATDPPAKDRFAQLELLRQHVRDRCKGLEITEDEADGLLAVLLELDAAKKKADGPGNVAEFFGVNPFELTAEQVADLERDIPRLDAKRVLRQARLGLVPLTGHGWRHYTLLATGDEDAADSAAADFEEQNREAREDREP